MRDARLTDAQKTYIVKRLAAYDTLTSIVRGLKTEFGVTITQQAVGNYNPETARRGLAQRWKDLFGECRRAYIASTADIGMTNKPARLRRREAMMHRAWVAGRHGLANEILDSVAHEIDASFRRRRK
jgi:hypothetical protein